MYSPSEPRLPSAETSTDNSTIFSSCSAREEIFQTPEGQPLSYSQAVPYQDTFLIVGGLGGRDNSQLDDIYQWDVKTKGWVKRDERLRTARHQHVVLIG